MESPPQTEESRASSRMGRIGEHLAGISEDARDLVNLRVAMARNNVEEQVDEARSTVGKMQITAAVVQETIRYYLPAAIFGVVGLLFLFTTIGLWLGNLLGSYWMGFGIVTGVMLLIAGVYYALARRMQRRVVMHHESRANQRHLPEETED